MTEKYLKQLELEKLNKEIFDRITVEVSANDFIDFYVNHNKKETLEYYNIRTEKLLRKILEFFNYDFTKPKPSKFKGKSACRSHESYVNAGKKSAETQKQHWAEKSEDEKKAWSEKQKVGHNTESFKKQIKQINIDYQASLSEETKEQIKLRKSAISKLMWSRQREEILTKSYETKKQNRSFNMSLPEDLYYDYLVEKYGLSDVTRQYTDVRYPYACDFYIKSLDLFIELNLNWTHGKHLFDPTSSTDQIKLQQWTVKAKNSKFYQKAIEVWTVKDPEKFACAKRNNLNYIVYYNEAELYQ